jgi:hypothetical protein
VYQNSRSISAYFHSIPAITLFFISILSLCFVETSHSASGLVAQNYAVVSDDGDGAIEPNECVGISCCVVNEVDCSSKFKSRAVFEMSCSVGFLGLR